MDTCRVILHVGAAKVGSSSLQTALTAGAPGAEYLLWRADGSFDQPSLTDPDDLRHPFGYESSSFALTDLDDWSSADVARARSTLVRLSRGSTVVLSSEAWCGQALSWGVGGRARLAELLRGPGVDGEIVLYVRPPAPWLESAYLQFGIWTGTDLPSYAQFLAHEREACWDARAAVFDGVAPVGVRFTDDVVSDFFGSVLGVAPPDAAPVANPRISLDLLALLLLRPELRVGGSLGEFLLAREADRLGLEQRPVPSLLGGDLVRQVESAHADDVERLLSRLSAQQAADFMAAAEAFAAERADSVTVSRDEMRGWRPDPGFEERLLSREVMARLGDLQRPDEPAAVLRPQDRGAPTNWRNRGAGHWLNRMRSSQWALRMVPRESTAARWMGAVADRVL